MSGLREVPALVGQHHGGARPERYPDPVRHWPGDARRPPFELLVAERCGWSIRFGGYVFELFTEFVDLWSERQRTLGGDGATILAQRM